MLAINWLLQLEFWIKNELVHRTQYPTREHARKGIA